MKEQKKKLLVVVLLAISCFISGYLLFFSYSSPSKSLQSFAQVDSLIEKQFSRFNIDNEQVLTNSTRIDSNFSRKTYTVGLPYRFSKTQFHAELNSFLYPYNITTPAQVTFPEKNLNIHLSYQETVIRTISLQTDPELSMAINNITLLMVFEDPPTPEILRELARLAEPIPVVIKVEKPMQVQKLQEKLNEYYPSLVFWFQNKKGNDLLETNPEEAIATFKRLQQVSPSANVLVIQDQANADAINKLAKLQAVTVSNTRFLQEELGKDSFHMRLKEFQANPNPLTALVTGSSTTISWLNEILPDLKRTGMNIVPPKI